VVVEEVARMAENATEKVAPAARMAVTATAQMNEGAQAARTVGKAKAKEVPTVAGRVVPEKGKSAVVGAGVVLRPHLQAQVPPWMRGQRQLVATESCIVQLGRLLEGAAEVAQSMAAHFPASPPTHAVRPRRE
jgi:hypothetical protein